MNWLSGLRLRTGRRPPVFLLMVKSLLWNPGSRASSIAFFARSARTSFSTASCPCRDRWEADDVVCRAVGGGEPKGILNPCSTISLTHSSSVNNRHAFEKRCSLPPTVGPVVVSVVCLGRGPDPVHDPVKTQSALLVVGVSSIAESLSRWRS